jgi:hypothetical protein
VLCDFLVGKVARLHRLALFTRSAPGLHEETIGAPKFPQVLHCPFALFFDPGRIAASDHYEASNVVPVSHHNENSNDKFYFVAQ